MRVAGLVESAARGARLCVRELVAFIITAHHYANDAYIAVARIEPSRAMQLHRFGVELP